jgi:hypothetical protein
MPQVGELAGLWRRSLIAWPDGRSDATSSVHWLQGLTACADLRQPAAITDLSHLRRLSDLSRQDCLQLAQQQGFSGYLTFDGRHFEWTRAIDYQPPGPHPDAGALHWEGDVLIETGRDSDYVEHWHLQSPNMPGPIVAATLVDAIHGIKAALVRVGGLCMFARDRAVQLPPYPTLTACIIAAKTLREAQHIVDCEISLAKQSADGFLIAASTLPFRVGKLLQLDLQRDWQLLNCEGDHQGLKL